MRISFAWLCYISKILKIESNSQQLWYPSFNSWCCVISQRYSKLKAIHNILNSGMFLRSVVLYLKDTQNWKQFTTLQEPQSSKNQLCYISKILKIESNSQQYLPLFQVFDCCVISQRYSKLKAIHNYEIRYSVIFEVVLYLKDTQNWKQFTTAVRNTFLRTMLCYISKILKIESNSQLDYNAQGNRHCCVISQRYSKLKAIHNGIDVRANANTVVLYLKDTQNWKQFTTDLHSFHQYERLCYISKILKIESNSQHSIYYWVFNFCCVISQRYSKLKAIHNTIGYHLHF